MAKKDHIDVKKDNGPYAGKSSEELISILEKKDNLLNTYTVELTKLRKQVEDDDEEYKKQDAEILKLREQVEECGEKYDEANQKTLETIERYNELEAKFGSYKAELDAEFKKQFADLKNTHDKELEGQIAADELKYNEAKEAYEAEIASVKKACQKEIESLKASRSDALDEQKSSLEKDFEKKLAAVEKKHTSEVNSLKAEIKKLETLSTEGVFSEKLRKRFLDASKKAINEAFDKLAEEAEAEVSDKKKVEEAVNKANNRLKWLKEQQDHNAAETEELMSLLKELTGGAEA